MAVLTGEDFANSLLSYDQRLQCTCVYNGGRCMRKAAAEDMRCDSCHDGDHDISEIVYYVAPAEALTREWVAMAMAAKQGHFLLLGFMVEGGV